MSTPLPDRASLHDRLRAETRAAHDRVEESFALDRHLASRAGYRALLERLHGLHVGFEAGLAPRLAGSALARPPRSGRIARDLLALGCDRAAIDRLPVAAPAILASEDRADAVGAAYVLEGSALGGLVIARQVAARLGLGPAGGAAFFAGDGRETAAGWRAFCEALDAEGSRLDAERVVAAADATFGFVEGWLAGEPARQVA